MSGEAGALNKSKLTDRVIAVVKEHGGPTQYLRHQLESIDDATKFAMWLWETFPEEDRQHYEHMRQLPPATTDDRGITPPLCVHVSSLGYAQECSLKEYPTLQVFGELIEQYIVEGFIKSSDPLIFSDVVTLPTPCPTLVEDEQDGIYPFTIGYVKGMARSCNVLALLHCLWRASMCRC